LECNESAVEDVTRTDKPGYAEIGGRRPIAEVVMIAEAEGPDPGEEAEMEIALELPVVIV